MTMKTALLLGIAFWLGSKWFTVAIVEPEVCVGGKDVKGHACTPAGLAITDEIDPAFVDEVGDLYYKKAA